MPTTALPQTPATASVPSRSLATTGFAAALRSEWIKATTVRANRVILGVAAVISVVAAGGSAIFITQQELTVAMVFVYPTSLTPVLATIAGVLLFTAEVQHGTLAAAVAAHPARWPIAAAKAVVAGGLGTLLGVVGLLAGVAGASAGGLALGDTTGIGASIGWALLYTTGSGVLGLGVGMVVRHSAGAVAGVLVWAVVIESLILGFAPAEVVRFLPFDTAYRTLGIQSDFDSPDLVAAGLSSVAHASIFWAYVVAALAIGTIMFRRNDID